MTLIRSILAVLRMEWRRNRPWGRLLLWLGLIAFPVLIIALLRWAMVRSPDPRLWTFSLYFLITEFTTCMGMLLGMAPAIQVELENRSWIYVAMRPQGRHAALLGKYVSALLWTLSASWVALALALLWAEPLQPARTWAVLALLSGFSALGRGAVYAWIGVAFPYRAMIVSVVYTVMFEYLVGWIPAVVNKFTVQFHVRCLLMRWLELEEWMGGVRWFFDTRPAIEHVLALVAFTFGFLSLAWVWLDQRTFTSSQEG